jgi:hypothetical protein
LPAGSDLPGRVYGRYQAGTGCLIAGTRRAAGPGGRPPAGTCRALPGGHRVLVRWESAGSQGRGGPRSDSAGHCQAGTVCLIAGRMPARRTQWARPPLCGLRTESAVRAARAGRASPKEASGPVSGPRTRARAPSGQTSIGRHGVLTCWGPVNRVAQWQDSDRCQKPAPRRQGNRATAGGDHHRTGAVTAPGGFRVIPARLRELRTGSTWSVH